MYVNDGGRNNNIQAPFTSNCLARYTHKLRVLIKVYVKIFHLHLYPYESMEGRAEEKHYNKNDTHLWQEQRILNIMEVVMCVCVHTQLLHAFN